MIKPLLFIGLGGAAVYYLQDRLYAFLYNIEVMPKGIEAVDLGWEESRLKLKIGVKNKNKVRLVLQHLDGKIRYQIDEDEVDVSFEKPFGQLVLEPGQQVLASFTIRFANADPLAIIADLLKKRRPVPIRGTVTGTLGGKNVKVPYATSI